MTSPKISRRAVLRGLGTMVALPALESLTPARAFASTAAPTPSPLRMAFYYVPNGAHMAAWTPAAEGAEFTLPATPNCELLVRLPGVGPSVTSRKLPVPSAVSA